MTRPRDDEAADGTRYSDEDLGVLLARGHARDPRRERVIANVLQGVARAEPDAAAAVTATGTAPRRGPGTLRGRWSWRWPMLGGVAAATVAVAVLLVTRPPRPARDDAWSSRGGEGRAAEVEVGCSGGTLDACPLGSTLLFRVLGAGKVGFLIAFADPLFAGGSRVWYFAGAHAPPLTDDETSAPLRRGIRIGSEHRPGAYLVHLLVTRAQLSAAEAVRSRPAADILSEDKLRLVVTR